MVDFTEFGLLVQSVHIPGGVTTEFEPLKIIFSQYLVGQVQVQDIEKGLVFGFLGVPVKKDQLLGGITTFT
jgi:hypothetical protein